MAGSLPGSGRPSLRSDTRRPYRVPITHGARARTRPMPSARDRLRSISQHTLSFLQVCPLAGFQIVQFSSITIKIGSQSFTISPGTCGTAWYLAELLEERDRLVTCEDDESKYGVSAAEQVRRDLLFWYCDSIGEGNNMSSTSANVVSFLWHMWDCDF